MLIQCTDELKPEYTSAQMKDPEKDFFYARNSSESMFQKNNSATSLFNPLTNLTGNQDLIRDLHQEIVSPAQFPRTPVGGTDVTSLTVLSQGHGHKIAVRK